VTLLETRLSVLKGLKGKQKPTAQDAALASILRALGKPEALSGPGALRQEIPFLLSRTGNYFDRLLDLRFV
jgi:hypothetical protein